jgi:trimethylamine--corrinoid protein Co-methyltransferase
MKFLAQVLSESEQQRVHAESLRILAEVGVKYLGKTALPLLKQAGAQVDEASQIVRIPAQLVTEAMHNAPKTFTLGARNPAYDYPLPSPVTRYCIDGTATFTLDFHTGERRYGTLKDIEDSLRIFQQLDMGVMAWAPTTASEAPAGSRALHEFFAMAKFCSKHGQHELHFASQVPYLVEGLVAVMGSEETLRQRTPFSLIYCPVAPLVHDGEMLDAYLELGRIGLPVMIMPMPVPGTTGPASLFANICQANAEALSAFVVFQLAHPGRPLIYSNATGTVDFRNGAYLGGSPEMGLMAGALTQMGRFYGLPSTSAGCTADAKQPGPEAILEKLVTALPPVFAGADIIIGLGEIEGDQLLVLEQLVVDNEIAHFCERLAQGVDASPSKELFEDIAHTGPGGNYLKLRSTRLAARSDEFFYPLLFDRQTPDKWSQAGKPTLYTAARAKVQEILAGPVVDPLPEQVSAALDAILARADLALN